MVNSQGNPVKSTPSKVGDPLKFKKSVEKKPRGESASENAGRRSASPGMKEREPARYEFESKVVPKGHRTDRRRHGSDRETAAGGKGDGENVSDREHGTEVSPEHHVEHSTKHVKRLRTSRGNRSEGSKRSRGKTEVDGDSPEKAVFKEEGSPKDETHESMEDKEQEKEHVEPVVEAALNEKDQETAMAEQDVEPVTEAKEEMTLEDKAPETNDAEVKADEDVPDDVTDDVHARPSEETTEIMTENVKVTETQTDIVDAREEAVKYAGAPMDVQAVAEQKVDNAEPDTSLSLGLSGPRRMNRTKSYQTISQAETFSHGITTSLSLSCSHQFTHNPSCSLAQTSHDNQEFSSASQPVNREPSQSVGKKIDYGDSVRQRDLSRGEHHSSHSRPKGSMHRKQVKSASLTRSADYSDRWNGISRGLLTIVQEIVSEPVPLVARKMQDLPGEVLEELKTSVRDLLERSDKRDEFQHLQRILQSRSDLSADSLQMANRIQLEILVALRTGIPGFLLDENQMKILIEVFLRLRCPNVQCLNQLPVDDCECKICTQKSGFCYACMCVVCSKFDFEHNTCSWVGCDYCVHWCHTECGLRKSYIRSGQTINGPPGASEMQFHCVACGKTSELFGFVKAVFSSCARAWNRTVLCKELECARRMFQGSEDVRGKQLCRKADQLLRKLDTDSDVAEACNSMLRFFEESANLPLEQENSGLGERSTTLERAALALHNYDRLLEEKRTDAAEMQYERAKKKAEIEELESIVRIKQAEAKMFQARADEAAREAEGLQRIVMAKRLKDDEEYAAKKSKLQLVEAEEKRKRKFESLKVLERGSYNFDIVRTLMGDLQGLLTNMESAKRLKADDVSGVEKYLQRYLQSRAI